MKRKTKKDKPFFETRDFWLILIILIFSFYSGLFDDWFNFGDDSLKPARIEIDYGFNKRAFEGEVLPDMSVLDALLAAGRAGDFEIRYALLNDRTDIMKIDNFSEDGLDGQWRFYLNKKEILADQIHKVKIKPGDRILAEFK